VIGGVVDAADRVLVIASVGMRNVGDEAILEGLVQQLPARDRVVAVSGDPAGTREMHRLRAISVWATPFWLLWCNVLVISGGLFSGHMGPKQRLTPLLVQLALLMRIKCIFHGVGIYPSTPLKIQKRLRRIVARLTLITVRDEICVDFVRQLGGEAHLVPDLSLSMPAAPVERAEEILAQEDVDLHRPLVGLALTATGIESPEPLVREFSTVINEMPDTQFLFIPMCQHPRVAGHNDLLLADALQRRAPSLRILHGWYRPQEVLAVYGVLDAAICMRYHSLLFAHRTGCNIIALPYSEKCDDFVQRNNLSTTEIDAMSLVQALSDIEDDG